MDGLRNFVEVDNPSAVDVGCLRRGTKSIQVKKPQFSEAFPETVIREGADDLTLRAGEVARGELSSTGPMLRSSDGDRRWWMRTGTPFCRLYTRELKENNGKRCTITTESCTRRQGPKKLGDSQKAKAFWTSGKRQRQCI